MLDTECYQTVFKLLARSNLNVMASICNDFKIMETTDHNRYERTYFGTIVPNKNSKDLSFRLKYGDMGWTNASPRSSSAGFAARADSSDPRGRLATLVGRPTEVRLSIWELSQLQELWAKDVPAFQEYLELYREHRRRNKGKFDDRIDNVNDWSPRFPTPT